MMQSDYDPRRARAKRPMPMWWDAFHRDTQHLQADEVGAYMMILGAMWRSVDCSLPNDKKTLSLIARVSPAVFKKRIGPKVLALLDVTETEVISWRLRKEAFYTEISCTKQHCKKTGNDSANILKSLGWGLTTDGTTVKPRIQPTQLPNNPTVKKESPSDSCRSEKGSGDFSSLFGDPEETPLPDDAEIGFQEFNSMAERAGLPKAQLFTDSRKKAMKARLKEAGGLDGWRVCLDKTEASDFLTGKATGWKANIDFLLSLKSFAKIMEGNYDNDRNSNPTGGTGGTDPRRRDPHLQQMAGFAAVADRGRSNR